MDGSQSSRLGCMTSRMATDFRKGASASAQVFRASWKAVMALSVIKWSGPSAGFACKDTQAAKREVMRNDLASASNPDAILPSRVYVAVSENHRETLLERAERPAGTKTADLFLCPSRGVSQPSGGRHPSPSPSARSRRPPGPAGEEQERHPSEPLPPPCESPSGKPAYPRRRPVGKPCGIAKE